MGLEVTHEPDDLCTLRVSGVWKRSEFEAAQNDLATRIDGGAQPRLLVVGEDFQGWERGADWNDLDFLISHSGKIAKIAIVAELRWEAHALAFAGAGLRRAPVKFFLPQQMAEARSWLSDERHS
jgi:hypothetical protein